jgi:hypothetical protein
MFMKEKLHNKENHLGGGGSKTKTRLEWNPHVMAYLLGESAHIYWVWDLESEVHSIWDL